jgi:hypothetical protein
MSTVREILLARKAEISSAMGPMFEECTRFRKSLIEAEGKVAAAQDELKQIETALKALDEAQTKRANPTIMQAVLEVLSHKPDGMTAKEILAEINAKYFGGRIERHSLSPQLSRLKDRDEKIELHGDRWIRLPDEPSLFRRRV